VASWQVWGRTWLSQIAKDIYRTFPTHER
jgi:hypothetical protein